MLFIQWGGVILGGKTWSWIMMRDGRGDYPPELRRIGAALAGRMIANVVIIASPRQVQQVG